MLTILSFVQDLVQFVQFNKHCHNSVELTQQTLHEIPTQLEGHFKSRGIAPLPAVNAAEGEIIVEEEEEEIDLSLDITDDEIVVTGGGDSWVDGFNASR